MNEPKKTDPEAQLIRLVDALDDAPPTDEEARRTCEALGIDLDALHAKLVARVDAHEADRARRAEEEGPPRPLRAPADRRATRRAHAGKGDPRGRGR
jgi:hypothetical protein